MSKKKNKKTDEVKEVKPFIITAATINDDFCNYSFLIKDGVGIGDTHNVKGSGIVDEDLKIAFSKLNVHFACCDDNFEDVENIDKFHNDPLTLLYNVTGFQIKGNDENESIVLIGNKYLNKIGERSDIKMPRILLSAGTSYQWYNELKDAADTVRMEVELYKGGKSTPVEVSEKVDPNQLTINEQISEMENDFENAKI